MTLVVLVALLVAAAAPGGPMSAPDAPPALVDFARGDAGWFVVDDGVMGGLSQGRVTATDEGTAVFSGTLSLENSGGFSSARGPVDGAFLAGWDGIAARVRGDGRTYRLRLRTDDRFDGIAWQADLPTVAGEWVEVAVPFDEFVPVFRGRRVRGAGPLDPVRVRQAGVLLADKTPGPFRLELARLVAWRRPAPSPDPGEAE